MPRPTASGELPGRFIDFSDTEVLRNKFKVISTLSRLAFRNILISNEDLSDADPAGFLISRKRETEENTAYETGVSFARYVHKSLIPRTSNYFAPVIDPLLDEDTKRTIEQFLKHGDPIDEEALRQRRIDFYGKDFELAIGHFARKAEAETPDLVWENDVSLYDGYYDYLATVTILESDPSMAKEIAHASADGVTFTSFEVL